MTGLVGNMLVSTGIRHSLAHGAGVRPPDVVIVGAQKAATTGLLRTLAGHASVVTPRSPEAVALHAGPGAWTRAMQRYEPHLANVAADRQVVVKLATAMHFPDTLKAIRELNPAVRLVAVLRHPVDRMLSLHRYATQHGLESRPVEVALRDDVVQRAGHWRLRSYSGGSCYADAIATVDSVFDRDQVLFLDFAEVSSAERLEAVQAFVGLAGQDLEAVRSNESRPPRSRYLARISAYSVARAIGRCLVPPGRREAVRSYLQRANSARAEPPQATIPADLRAALLDRHAPDVEAAEQAMSRDLAHWRA